MDEMNVTQALLKAILELIEKCETLEELRESVKRIMNDEKLNVSDPPTKANHSQTQRASGEALLPRLPLL